VRYFLILFMLVFLPVVHSWAESKPAIDKSICKYLIAHEYNLGNEAEYKAGVDVKGKPVIEADISPQVIKMPKEYSFPITINMAKYMGINIPAGLLAESKLGTIKINSKSGEITFNGEAIEGNAEKALKELCINKKLSIQKK